MSLKRQMRRAMERKVAKEGTEKVLAKVDIVSRRSEREMVVNRVEDTKRVLAMTMAVPVTVLCRDLKWQALDGTPKDYNRRLARFMVALQEELDRVFDDPTFTLQKYVDRVYEQYGVKCQYGEE